MLPGLLVPHKTNHSFLEVEFFEYVKIYLSQFAWNICGDFEYESCHLLQK